VTYQRDGDIEKASSYVEAVIYNLTMSLEMPENEKLLGEIEMLGEEL
jgi:hypothetical protein